MKVRAFITHKLAESYSDCADYYSINQRTGRIAVCDGISQSFRPLEWAKILATGYSDGNFDPCDFDSIKPLQKKWQESLLLYLKELQDAGRITYGVENNINERKSAGSTFCGIQFDGNNWKAKILGDSSLVSIDEFGAMTIYSSQEGAFNNRPDYYDSYEKPVGIVREVSGKLERGQILLMVSDPFSELFQKWDIEGKTKQLMEKILSVNTQASYPRLIDYLRSECNMHNDDSTLLIIEHDGKDELSVISSEYLEAHIEAESVNINLDTGIAPEESASSEKINTANEPEEVADSNVEEDSARDKLSRITRIILG